MTLTEFLLARIAEDEKVARVEERALESFSIGMGGLSSTLRSHEANGISTTFIDYTRVLAECDAKRQIVALSPPLEHYAPFEEEWKWCPKALPGPLGDLPGGPDEKCLCNADVMNARGGPDVLRALALPYADHPDYQQEWAL